MSKLMTQGVIRMPIEIAMNDDLSKMQYHARANGLLDHCLKLESMIERLIETGEANTGNEPSISCWQRCCHEARQLIEER